MVRRELWDIKHQIMSGSDDNQGDFDDKVMQYMGSDDVIRGVYEGGFKTWECSLDLANHLAKDTHLLENLQTVLELGCGTSLPTLHLFTRALESGKGLRMVIQDYNLPVLQLSTIPSLFLIWSRHRSAEQSWDREGEISISEEDRRAFLLDLDSRGISIQGISGSWSPEMVAMIGQADLIVASETIYSSSNLPSFVQMLQGTLSDSGTALVAAKCVYFGVGGGVDEFTRQCEEQKLRPCPFFESNTGVRRTILSIERPIGQQVMQT